MIWRGIGCVSSTSLSLRFLYKSFSFNFLRNASYFRPHWSPTEIESGISEGKVLCGKLRVPAFQTDQAFVIVEKDNTSTLKEDTLESLKAPENSDHRLSKHSSPSYSIPLTGFVSRNRAVHGDSVFVLLDSTKTRFTIGKVVGIASRNPSLESLICTFEISSTFPPEEKNCSQKSPANNSYQIIAQPKDVRLPALEVRISKAQWEKLLLPHVKEKALPMTLAGIVQFSQWRKNQNLPDALLTSVIGETSQVKTEAFAHLLLNSLNPFEYSKKILTPLEKKLNKKNDAGIFDWLTSAEKDTDRLDYRKTRQIFTIDPKTAKDLDDAISILPIENGLFEVGVHVADVSHFVPLDSALDREAAQRATTVYLDTQVFPMLPRILSEDVCSLLPAVDRLCFSVFFVLDAKGNLVEAHEKNRLEKTIIRSLKKFSYEQVEEIIVRLDKALTGRERGERRGEERREETVVESHSEIVSLGEYLMRDEKLMRELEREFDVSRKIIYDIFIASKITRQKKTNQIKLDANFHAYFEFQNSDPIPKDLKLYDPSPIAHDLIQQLMIVANHQASKKLMELDPRYAIIRRHSSSEKEALEGLLENLPDHVKQELTMKGSHLWDEETKKLKESASLHELIELSKQVLSPEAFSFIQFSIIQLFDAAEYISIFDARKGEKGEGEETREGEEKRGEETKERKERKGEETKGEENLAHWGLGLASYMHFTSPIRRYADVVVHRALSHSLKKKQTPRVDIQAISNYCNEKKKKAQDVQMLFRSWLMNRMLEENFRGDGLRYANGYCSKILMSVDNLMHYFFDENLGLRENFMETVVLNFFIPSLQSSRSITANTLAVSVAPESLERCEPFAKAYFDEWKSSQFLPSSETAKLLPSNFEIINNYIHFPDIKISYILDPSRPEGRTSKIISAHQNETVRLIAGQKEWTIRLDIPRQPYRPHTAPSSAYNVAND